MSGKPKTPAYQEILEGFNKLRQEQRGIALKLAELEADVAEHSIVLDALEKVDKDRKCYRLIGGVLVERTVGEVVPALQQNKSQISQLTEVFNKKLSEKGKELNDFKEKHNIKVQNPSGVEEPTEAGKTSAKTSGVLVANNS
ncbi:prefoldin subunit 2-like [Styela clava]